MAWHSVFYTEVSIRKEISIRRFLIGAIRRGFYSKASRDSIRRILFQVTQRLLFGEVSLLEHSTQKFLFGKISIWRFLFRGIHTEVFIQKHSKKLLAVGSVGTVAAYTGYPWISMDIIRQDLVIYWSLVAFNLNACGTPVNVAVRANSNAPITGVLTLDFGARHRIWLSLFALFAAPDRTPSSSRAG